MKLTVEQAKELPFPIGCAVCYHFIHCGNSGNNAGKSDDRLELTKDTNSPKVANGGSANICAADANDAAGTVKNALYHDGVVDKLLEDMGHHRGSVASHVSHASHVSYGDDIDDLIAGGAGNIEIGKSGDAYGDEKVGIGYDRVNALLRQNRQNHQQSQVENRAQNRTQSHAQNQEQNGGKKRDEEEEGGQMFHKGVVTAVYMDLTSMEMMYEVDGKKGQGGESVKLPGKELAYAPNSTVFVSISSLSALSTAEGGGGTSKYKLKGRVMLCKIRPKMPEPSQNPLRCRDQGQIPHAHARSHKDQKQQRIRASSPPLSQRPSNHTTTTGNDSEIIQNVKTIKEELKKEQSRMISLHKSPDQDNEYNRRLLYLLHQLDKIEMNSHILSESRVIVVVSKLKSHMVERVANAAKGLVKKWMEVEGMEERVQFQQMHWHRQQQQEKEQKQQQQQQCTQSEGNNSMGESTKSTFFYSILVDPFNEGDAKNSNGIVVMDNVPSELVSYCNGQDSAASTSAVSDVMNKKQDIKVVKAEVEKKSEVVSSASQPPDVIVPTQNPVEIFLHTPQRHVQTPQLVKSSRYSSMCTGEIVADNRPGDRIPIKSIKSDDSEKDEFCRGISNTNTNMIHSTHHAPPDTKGSATDDLACPADRRSDNNSDGRGFHHHQGNQQSTSSKRAYETTEITQHRASLARLENNDNYSMSKRSRLETSSTGGNNSYSGGHHGSTGRSYDQSHDRSHGRDSPPKSGRYYDDHRNSYYSNPSNYTGQNDGRTSTPHSSAHDAGSHSSKGPFCRVKLPSWLVHDNLSKDRLHYHLTKVSGRDNHLTSIGHGTNCTLSFKSSDNRNEESYESRHTAPAFIFIQAISSDKDAKYDAKKDIRQAKEELENVLLEYINHDGSKGRLFYDMARFCRFLHARSIEHGPPSLTSSVKQRNPSQPSREAGWMNVVELPYSRDRCTDRKIFHGDYIIKSEYRLLPRINQETGCRITVCGDEFNVATRYCDPYVLIWGYSPERVDRAVEIVKDAIASHRRTCDCFWKT